jgi:hypothetical protein
VTYCDYHREQNPTTEAWYLFKKRTGLNAADYMFMGFHHVMVKDGSTRGLFLFKNKNSRKYINIDESGNFWMYSYLIPGYYSVSRNQAISHVTH